MPVDICVRHCKADKIDIPQIFLVKILAPVKRNVTAFDDKVLLVLNGSFYHLANYGPEVSCQLVIILRGKLCISASDQAHLKMIYGKIRKLVFF